MKKRIKDLYYVEHADCKITPEIRKFVEKWHYSKSCKSQKPIHIFEMRYKSTGILAGVAIYGQPIGRNSVNHYGNVIELRRLCLIDKARYNSESFFIAKTIKWLKMNTNYTAVLSYSDPNVGHSGTIYKASNFDYLGKQKSTNPVIYVYKGKKYHARQVYQRGRAGVYTPKAKVLQTAIKQNKAGVIKQEKKDIFLYKLGA